MDHWFQMEQMAPATDPMLEGYTSLGFVAGHTETMTLGLLVTGVTYRHPGLLAKIVATLDVLSGGRAQLGIGAAWYEREHRGLGVPYPPVAERFERLEETLQICRQMWSDDDGPFEGRHYQLAETICSPRPISQPHPPILIGGSGERKTLRLVARYADACNLFAVEPRGGRPQARRAAPALRHRGPRPRHGRADDPVRARPARRRRRVRRRDGRLRPPRRHHGRPDAHRRPGRPSSSRSARRSSLASPSSTRPDDLAVPTGRRVGPAADPGHGGRPVLRHGFHAVGVDLVIERAGVAKTTLYRHFPSKDDLIVAYLERRQRPVLGRGSTAPSTRPPRPGAADRPVRRRRHAGHRPGVPGLRVPGDRGRVPRARPPRARDRPRPQAGRAAPACASWPPPPAPPTPPRWPTGCCC